MSSLSSGADVSRAEVNWEGRSCGDLCEALRQRSSPFIPAGLDPRSGVLDKDAARGGHDHALVDGSEQADNLAGSGGAERRRHSGVRVDLSW